MKRKLMIVTSVLALTACGKLGGAAEPTGQVVATIDGKEITATELKAEMQRGAPNQDVALDALLTRRILANEARKQGLDKTPEGAMTVAASEEAALAGLLRDTLAKTAPKASPDEAREFVATNPALFANRRVYTLDQLIVPQVTPALIEAIKPLDTLEQVEGLLRQRNVQFNKTVGTVDPLQLGPDVAKQMAALPAGAVFMTPEGGVLRINRARSSDPAPITGAEAEKLAGDLLARQRGGALVSNQMREIVEKARKDVKFNPQYKPKEPAKAPAAAPAAK